MLCCDEETATCSTQPAVGFPPHDFAKVIQGKAATATTANTAARQCVVMLVLSCHLVQVWNEGLAVVLPEIDLI